MKIVTTLDGRLHFSVKYVEKMYRTVTKLFYHRKDPGWSYPGKLCAELHDDGNGLIFMKDKSTIYLDYCAAEELYLLYKEYVRKQK